MLRRRGVPRVPAHRAQSDAKALQRELLAHLEPVALFGGGHVGAALARLLATLPFAVRWIDSRDGVFPDALPAQIETEHSEPVQDAVAQLAPGSRVLIMSFSHAEDLDIVIACLKRLRARNDLPYVGLIGSKTKWATFRHRLEARGFTADELARITCPIGVPGIARQGARSDRRGRRGTVVAIAERLGFPARPCAENPRTQCAKVYTLQSTSRSGARHPHDGLRSRHFLCLQRPQW